MADRVAQTSSVLDRDRRARNVVASDSGSLPVLRGSFAKRLFASIGGGAVTPEFVTFHSDRPAGLDGVHPNANLEGTEYMRMVDMLFRSARLWHRDAACTLLTDERTVVNGVKRVFKRADFDIEHSSLMLSRSLAQLAYLEGSQFLHPLILIDSDILVNRPLTPIFTQDFDVALTWRLNKLMPINGGLLILNNRRPAIVREFFRRFLATYREQYADRGQWFGDQLALRDIVGLSYRALSRSHIVTVHGCRILLLPCETFNYSPECRFQSILEPLDDKVILHFKGPRKMLMEPYWQTYLEPRERIWPVSRFAGGRARLRLRDRIGTMDEIAPEASDDEA